MGADNGASAEVSDAWRRSWPASDLDVDARCRSGAEGDACGGRGVSAAVEPVPLPAARRERARSSQERAGENQGDEDEAHVASPRLRAMSVVIGSMMVGLLLE